MSCGGNGSSVASGDPWPINEDNYASPTYKQPGECDEGYLGRAGNAEQDATGGPAAINTIQNISIPVGIDLSINVQMMLTTGSDPVDHWTNGTSIAGASFSTSGLFSSTISVPGKYATTITAYRADGSVIDTKSYQIIASKSTGDDSIKFIHPLPGSVITSRCTASVDGTQIWSDPKRGRPHKGIDLAYVGGKIGNVRAAASGEVIRAVSDGSATGYGNVIYIGHKNSSGKQICITVYAHLSTIAVEVGQQVSAGDYLGVEGNVGVSTGAHLHFEIRSPEFATSLSTAAVYDPAAYITGAVSFDDVTSRQSVDAGGDPKPDAPVATNETTQNNGNSVAITPALIANKCSGYTPEPGNPGPGASTPVNTNPAVTGECQNDANNFLFKYEVGPWFNPNDTVTQQGLIDTSQNRKKCGYVVDTGGETKFGIAKNSNQSVTIATLTLSGAQSIYSTKYWFQNSCDKFPNPMCIIHYDTVVNGGAAQCLQAAFGTSSASDAATKASAMTQTALNAASKVYLNARQNRYADLANGNPSKYGKYLQGWTSRVTALTTFCGL